MKSLFLFSLAWIVITHASVAQDDEAKAALLGSYSSAEWSDSRITTALLNAVESASPAAKALLYVRLAEIEKPFLGDERKMYWYKKALDSDPACMPALAGISVFSMGITNGQSWSELWLRRDPSNAAPYFVLAFSEQLYHSNHVASLNTITKGNGLRAATFHPLFAYLDQEQHARWTSNVWDQAYAGYGVAHVFIARRFEAMERNLFSGSDPSRKVEQRLLAAAFARMYDLLAVSEPFSTLMFLRFMPLSIRSLERSVSGEPRASEQVRRDVGRLIEQRRNLLDRVRHAEGVPDWILQRQLKDAVKAMLDASPTKVFDRAGDQQ